LHPRPFLRLQFAPQFAERDAIGAYRLAEQRLVAGSRARHREGVAEFALRHRKKLRRRAPRPFPQGGAIGVGRRPQALDSVLHFGESLQRVADIVLRPRPIERGCVFRPLFKR
jgi:hypothetical protein